MQRRDTSETRFKSSYQVKSYNTVILARYLCAELITESDLNELVQWLQNRKRDRGDTGQHLEIPYMFKTPQGLEIDLRLFDSKILNKARPQLIRILKSCLKEWYIERRQEFVAHLRKKKISEEDLVKMVNETLAGEYLDRVADAIESDKVISDLGPGVSGLLIKQLRTVTITNKIITDITKQFQQKNEDAKESLQKRSPILSRVKPWLDKKLTSERLAYFDEHQWQAHNETLSGCKEAGLSQSCYFLSRDLTFMKDREPVLRKELKGLKKPCHTFKFETKIWLPKNWSVYECIGDKREEIPTVVSSSSGDAYHHLSQSDIGSSRRRFELQKYSVRENTTARPFWRWTNFFYRTSAWFWNILLFLGVVVPFRSHVSFCALFFAEPFYPDRVLDQRNGSLQVNRNLKINTVRSRFSALWSNIRDSRKDFEEQPDTGLLPKTISRGFNRFINYVVKGVGGTFLVLFVLPPVYIAASIASLFLAITSPVWVPFGSAFIHIFAILFCDFYGAHEAGISPFCGLNSPFCNTLMIHAFQILAMGILQPVLALFVGVFLCPLGFLVLGGWAYLKLGLRSFWDNVVFHTVIKRWARIPDRNTFLAKRVAGPGMASGYYYQVRPEQVLVALEAKMEEEELSVFQKETRAKIRAPLDDYLKLAASHLSIFGVTPNKKVAGPCQQLEKECEKLLSDLNEKARA